jgi:hypothetical protein
MKKRNGKTVEPGAGKKKYRKPQLRIHGDIRAITKAKAGTRTDGTGLPKTKTTAGP